MGALQQILDDNGYSAKGWELEDPNSDESYFVCPCGDTIEQDGKCSEGHVSPLRELGMI